MKRIAVEEALLPSAVASGLREMGFELRDLPREPSVASGLIDSFPADIVILPFEPGAPHVATWLRQAIPTVQVVVATERVSDLDVQPAWADLVIPKEGGPILWMLSMLALRPEAGASDRGPKQVREMLVTAIERTHHAFRAMEIRRAPHDPLVAELRRRLSEAFAVFLKILLDRLQRDIRGFAGRSTRVASLAQRLGSTMAIGTDRVQALRLAGSLHDIGMHLLLPSPSLGRAGPLHRGEWQHVRSHPIASAAVLAPLAKQSVTAAIREHHERLDGSGYPLSKRGDEVSLEARILGVADAYDALTHPRPHRPQLGNEEALGTLDADVRAGRLDADVVEALRVAVA